ncbi:hypothetical protein ACLOJK_034392 [Asimina triloba]
MAASSPLSKLGENPPKQPPRSANSDPSNPQAEPIRSQRPTYSVRNRGSSASTSVHRPRASGRAPPDVSSAIARWASDHHLPNHADSSRPSRGLATIQ